MKSRMFGNWLRAGVVFVALAFVVASCSGSEGSEGTTAGPVETEGLGLNT